MWIEGKKAWSVTYIVYDTQKNLALGYSVTTWTGHLEEN